MIWNSWVFSVMHRIQSWNQDFPLKTSRLDRKHRRKRSSLLRWRHDIQHNDTQRKGLLCGTQHKWQLA